jgi:hypothetical protein
MKITKLSFAVLGIVVASSLGGCIHVEDEGEARTTRTTTTSGGILTPTTTTVERTTVVDD